MTRHKPNNRPNGRGTLYIERTYPQPVGLLRLASGTNDAKAYRDILSMLDNLARSVPPRYDVLLAIKARTLAPLYALSLWRQGQLEKLPTADTLPPLEPAWEAWRKARTGISEDYRNKLGLTVRYLVRHGKNPTVGDLPMLLESFREECVLEGKPTQFNRVKAHVQAFVKATLRRRSQLYAEVSDIDTLEEADPLRRPQKPDALAEILQLLPEPHRRMAWELAVTGMRPKEYFGRAWQVVGPLKRVQVQRSKTDAGRREIPMWWGDSSLSGPARSRDAFEDMWRRRVGALLDIYDLRRSFAVWMEDAGIPRSRRKIYLGHAAGDVTGLYETRELLAWIEEDSERLRTYAPQVRRLMDAWPTIVGADGEGTDAAAAPAYAGRAGDGITAGGA